MTDKILGNNQVNIYGEVVSEFAFSHEVYGEGFYMVYLSVKRLSQVYDKIPLMVSERLIEGLPWYVYGGEWTVSFLQPS